MARWKTPEIVKLLEDTGLAEVTVTEAGGDYDTEVIYAEADYRKNEDFITVRGFVTGRPSLYDQGKRDDCEIEMIEVTDGKDSDGGLYSDDEATCVLYGMIVSRLRKAGFSVVPKLKAYF